MLDSSTINKIQKAKQYAQEREQRIHFQSFRVEIEGDNHRHQTTYESGAWSCDCEFFKKHGSCSHTMAMERVLGPMLTTQTADAPAVTDLRERGQALQERARTVEALIASGLVTPPTPDDETSQQHQHPPLEMEGKPLSEVVIENRGPV